MSHITQVVELDPFSVVDRIAILFTEQRHGSLDKAKRNTADVEDDA